jgi:general secretion pathway protein M
MSWFYRQRHRDQIAILLLVAALVLYGLWFGVVRTLQQQAQQQQRQLASSAETLLRVQALAGEIRILKQQGRAQRASPINLTQLVDRSLRQNDLAMAGFQPGQDADVRLRLESARFDQLLRWLYQLEYDHGVRVGELSILPSRQSGKVSVQVQLLGGGQ